MSRPHPYHLSHRVAAAKAAEYMAKALDMEAKGFPLQAERYFHLAQLEELKALVE